MTPETQWTASKCHRVVQPLHSALGKLMDLSRTYPALIECPYTAKNRENIATLTTYNTHNEALPSRTASQKYTYSTRQGKLNSGVFGPVFVSSFVHDASTKASQKKKGDLLKSPNDVFDEFKAQSSVEYYSCVLAVFKAFRQFLLVIGNKAQVHSLLERSAFEVGRCIAMTEETIPEAVWYENTEPFRKYRRVITMGHGMQLVIEHAEILHHVLPAFIVESVGNNNIWMASLLAEHYMASLSNEMFWDQLRQLHLIASLTCTEGSFTLSSILSQLASRFKMTELKAKGLENFLNMLRNSRRNDVSASEHDEALLSAGFQCIQILLRGERRLQKEKSESETCQDLLLQFVQLIVATGDVESMDSLIAVFTKSRLREVLQSLKLYKSYREGVEIKTVPFPSSKFLGTLTTIFPHFDQFKTMMNSFWESNPKFVCKAAAHFVANGGKGLQAVEWQDRLQEQFLQRTLSLPATELALDSWVLPEEEEIVLTNEQEDYSETEDDEIIRIPASQPTPTTPRKDLQSKYGKTLPEGIMQWSARRSASKKYNDHLPSTPLRPRRLRLIPSSDRKESWTESPTLIPSSPPSGPNEGNFIKRSNNDLPSSPLQARLVNRKNNAPRSRPKTGPIKLLTSSPPVPFPDENRHQDNGSKTYNDIPSSPVRRPLNLTKLNPIPPQKHARTEPDLQPHPRSLAKTPAPQHKRPRRSCTPVLGSSPPGSPRSDSTADCNTFYCSDYGGDGTSLEDGMHRQWKTHLSSPKDTSTPVMTGNISTAFRLDSMSDDDLVLTVSARFLPSEDESERVAATGLGSVSAKAVASVVHGSAPRKRGVFYDEEEDEEEDDISMVL